MWINEGAGLRESAHGRIDGIQPGEVFPEKTEKSRMAAIIKASVARSAFGLRGFAERG